MKIIIVGASGKIGREIDRAVSDRHEVIRVGATSGDVQCDYTSADSVSNMFAKIGSFDALVAVAGGDSTFRQFEELVDKEKNTMKDKPTKRLAAGMLAFALCAPTVHAQNAPKMEMTTPKLFKITVCDLEHQE